MMHFAPILCVLSLFQGSRVPETHAIVNAKIVLGDGTTIEKGRVIIRDGRIAAADAGTETPPDALVYDAAGLTVYPGFVDGFVTSGLKINEIVSEGTARDATTAAFATMRETHRKGIRPDISAVESLEVTDEVANARKQAGFAAAFFAPPGPGVSGRASLADLSGNARRDALLRADLAMIAELSPPPGDGYPGSTMGAIAQFRQVIYDADWYRKSWKAHQEHPAQIKAPPTDPILAALEPILDRAMPVVFVANETRDILRSITVAEELGLRPWIAGGMAAWKCAPMLAQKQIPVLLSLNFGAEPKDPRPPRDGKKTESAPESKPAAEPRAESQSKAESGAAESKADSKPDSKTASRPEEARWPNPDAMPERAREERKRRYDERLANAGILVKAGVKVVFTTAGLRGAGDFHGALQKAVEKGLSKEAALAALTTNAAEVFGAGESIGKIAVGRPAYLTIAKGNLGEKDFKIRAMFVADKRIEYDDDGEAPSSSPAPGGRRRGPREDQENGGAK
jgi:imidazolonepropionase-like amidohydrolase